MFKRLDTPYTPGRPNSGGSQFKFKFVATLSAVVSKINVQRSVEVRLLGDEGWQVAGNVTIPANQPVPAVGQVVEIQYLYAFPESGVLFQGIVTLHGTDLDSHAIYTMAENQPGAPMDILVAYEPFTKLVKGLGNKETITLGLEVKARNQVTGTELEKDLPSEPLDEFPEMPAVNQKPSTLGPEFGVALKQAFQCCSDDPTRQVLNGACLDGSGSNGHYIVGTNGRMLFSANSFTFDLTSHHRSGNEVSERHGHAGSRLPVSR